MHDQEPVSLICLNLWISHCGPRCGKLCHRWLLDRQPTARPGRHAECSANAHHDATIFSTPIPVASPPVFEVATRTSREGPERWHAMSARALDCPKLARRYDRTPGILHSSCATRLNALIRNSEFPILNLQVRHSGEFAGVVRDKHQSACSRYRGNLQIIRPDWGT